MRDRVAELADSEGRLRLATAAADVGTWDYHPVTDTLRWDDRCKALFVIAVTDTGVGMALEVLEKLVDPFFTTKPIGQGTGLGLSMIYRFVHQSGGQVRVHSQPGLKTTVSIYLKAGELERDEAQVGESRRGVGRRSSW